MSPSTTTARRPTRTCFGALGDIRLAVREGGLDDGGLLVIAADNLFEFPLRDYIAFSARKGCERPRGPPACRPEPRAPLRRRRAGRRRPRRRDGRRSRASTQRSRLHCHQHPSSPARTSGWLERYLDEGEPASRTHLDAFSIWLAEQGRVFGLRLPLIVARHRYPGAAPEGGQPLSGTGGVRPRAGVGTRCRQSVTKLFQATSPFRSQPGRSGSSSSSNLASGSVSGGEPGSLFCDACRARRHARPRAALLLLPARTPPRSSIAAASAPGGSARPAMVLVRPSSTPIPRAPSYLAGGGRSPPARDPGRRARRRASAPAGGRRHHVYPARRTTAACRRWASSLRKPSARELGRLWEIPVALSLARRRTVARQSRARACVKRQRNMRGALRIAEAGARRRGSRRRRLHHGRTRCVSGDRTPRQGGVARWTS